jgi:hypothetical protein
MRTSILKRLALLIVPSLVALAILAAMKLSVADACRWESSSIAADPPVVDLAHQEDTTITVTLVHTETDPVPASVTCTLHTGRVITVGEGARLAAGDVVTWAGRVSGTQAITFTVHPAAWPTTTVLCAIDDGAVHTFTGTVLVDPLKRWFPITMNGHAPAPPTPTAFFEAHPSGSWHLLAGGQDLQDALDGGDVEAWRYDHTVSAANLPPDGGRPDYHVERGYVLFDLARAPAGRIVSATLELYVYNLSDIQGVFTATFHEGTWAAPPSTSDWNACGPILGTYDTRRYTPGPDPVVVPLPGLIGRTVPPRLHLVLRGDEETQLGFGEPALQASFWLNLPDAEWVFHPASCLHLAIAEGGP